MRKNFLSFIRAYLKSIGLFAAMQLVCYAAGAQSYMGYQTSAYAGVYSMLNNPADILNHRVRADVNLVGISVGGGNNVVAFKFSQRNNDRSGFFYPDPITKRGKMNFNTDVFGPSLLIRLSDKHAFAITTRARLYTNVYGVGTPMLNSLLQDTISSFLINHQLSISDMFAGVHGWKEIALTYSRQIANSDFGVWKVGASVKYLGGIAALSFHTNNLGYTYDSLIDPADGKMKEAILNARGTFALDYTKTIDSIAGKDIVSFKNPGIGLDIGVNYEYREDMQVYENSYSEKTANYIWRVGASITDIGFIKYPKQEMKTINTRFSGNNYFTEQFNTPSDSSEPYQKANYYKNLFNARTEPSAVTMQLPTTLHLAYDRYFNKWLGVAAQLNVPLVFSKFNYYNGNYTPTSLYVTPRAEIPLGGLYMPISYNSISGFNMGAALRLGPLVVGFASLINARMAKTKGVDFYFILRVPIFGYRAYKEKTYGQEQPKLTKRQRRMLDCPGK
ncbi:DUF5723 family protein [Ferruginibacter sp.]